MDWSLVLASQGIEAVIEHFPGAQGWVLLVPPTEFDRAVLAIQQYRVENRRWAWRQHLEWPDVTFHWGVLFWCWALVMVFWLNESVTDHLVTVGSMNGRVPETGQWWRLVTAIGLHADVGHLAANLATGLALLGLAMARFGPGATLLATLLAGVLGNLAGIYLHPGSYLGLGASGMVMGALGLLAVQSISVLRQSSRAWRPVMTGLLGGFFLFILTGLNPASDVVAHTGGFVAGVVFGAGLGLLPSEFTQRRGLDRFALAVTLGVVVVAWALALRR